MRHHGSVRARLRLAFLILLILQLPSSAPSAGDRPSWDGTWYEIATTGPRPAARAIAAAIEDPVRQRMIVFGGTDDFAGGSYLGDVWALSLAGTPAWTQLFPAGTPPTPRLGSAAVYDPERDRMLVWSGYDGVNDRDEVWVLSLSEPVTWTRIVPLGPTPGGRGVSSLVYDSLRDRLVMFGGYHEGAHNDVWVLPLSGDPVWTQLEPAGARPAGRGFASAIFDPMRDQMTLYGGGTDLTVLGDVWELTFRGEPTWTEIHPEGPPPQARTGHCGVYDVARDRLAFYGGSGTNDLSLPALDDVWTLAQGAWPAWIELYPAGTPPPARAAHCGVFDGEGQALIVFGGMDQGVCLDDTWALVIGGPGDVPDSPRSTGMRLIVRGPNPLRAGDRIEIALEGPRAGEATFALYDVQGRRLDVLGAGTWTLPARAAGRYLLRARSADDLLVHPLVVLSGAR